MLDPEFSSQKARGATHKSTGDYISHKMPVSPDEDRSTDTKKEHEHKSCARLKPDHGNGKGGRHHHVAGGKAAMLVTVEEIKDMAWSAVKQH
jgi:hypothetical protein